MAVECDETDELSGEIDPVNVAITPLIEHIFAVTAPDSAERAAAMRELMLAVDRICVALRPKPSLN
jgi:hypothetical protein